MRTRLLIAMMLTGACGGGTSPDVDPGVDGGAPGIDGSVEPLVSQCDALERVDMTAAVEVADENALRTAVTTGGKIVLTADIAATAPFDIAADTVFDGGGHVIDGQALTHLFTARRQHVTIQNVTLRNANNLVDDVEHFSERSGAAIRVSGGSGGEGNGVGSLTIIDVVFEDNAIKATGPGDLRGGAVYAFRMPDVTISGATFTGNVGSNGGAIGGLGSSITIIDSVFAANQTNGTGPGGSLEGGGGAISLDAVTQNGSTAYLNICGSSFSNNRAQNGAGAIYLVAHAWTGTEVTIDQSLFDGNRVTSNEEGQGGAIFLMDDDSHPMPDSPIANRAQVTRTTFTANEDFNRGGGMWYWTNDGSLTIINTTFAGNRTREPDGMGGALAISRGPATIINSTFANNHALFHGGGIQAGQDAQVLLQNCLFSNNTSDREGGWANFHTNRPLDDGGGNMQYTDPLLVIDGNSDALVAEGAVRADPQIDALADNGGPTPTMALSAGSPAANAGVVGGAPAIDQRGLDRDGTPDIGAFEAQ